MVALALLARWQGGHAQLGYGIACKKVYSERGVEAQVRKGCRQLEPYGGAGLVGLNIDDLVPPDVLLRSSTNTEAGDFLASANRDFIERHRRNLQRFIVESRCDGILVSTAIISDILRSRVRLNNYTQVVLWTLEEAPQDAKERIQMLRSAIEAPRDL